MLKKTITFIDYDGTQKTRDFYFNMSKAELTEYRYSVSGGIEAKYNYISSNGNVREMIHMIKETILKSYGVKNDDGTRFYKDDEETKAFACSDAYSVMFLEFLEDPQKFVEFLRGIIPADYAPEFDSAMAEQTANLKAADAVPDSEVTVK